MMNMSTEDLETLLHKIQDAIIDFYEYQKRLVSKHINNPTQETELKLRMIPVPLALMDFKNDVCRELDKRSKLVAMDDD
jgi:hypothetical protein